MPFAVPLALVLGLLGAERAVAPPVTGLNPGSTDFAELVARPGGFYALYVDDRSPSFNSSRLGLRGAHLSATLEVLDPTGFRIALPPGAFRFRAVHDGTGLSLAWVDEPERDSWVVSVSRVSETGAVLMPAKTLGTSTNEIGAIAVAHDGTRTIVAWIEEGSVDSKLRAAAVDAAGNVTGPWTIAQASVQSVSVASSGGTTLIAWTVYRSTGSTLEAVRIAPGSAPPTTPTVLATRTNILYVDAVATPGNAWFLAWFESPAEGSVSVLGAPLPATGALGTPQTIDSVTSRYAIAPHLAFDGTNVRALWTVYLDVRARTVPLAGAPTSPVQILRDRLGYEPGAGIACSGATCAARWTEPAPNTSFTSAAIVTRLSAASAALDSPAREISFPADANTAPRIVPLGEDFGVLMERRIARNQPEIVLRRLDASGAWSGEPNVLGSTREIAAVTRTPSGGALVAARRPYLDDNHQLAGFAIAADGSVSETGPWVSPHSRPWDVHVACGTTKCGVLYEQSSSYLSAVLEPSGVLSAASNVYVSILGNSDSLHFKAVGSALVAVTTRYLFPVRAFVAQDTAFPAFATPVALGSSTESTNGDFRSVVSGSRLALIWSERNGCKVFGRVLDVVTGLPVGPDAVSLFDPDCENHYGWARSLAPRDGGYTVLMAESGADERGPFTDYWQRDTDADLVPIGPSRRIHSVPEELEGIALTRIGGKDVYSYARFDDSPRISAKRAFLAGLEPDAEEVPDAGSGPHAGEPDAGFYWGEQPDAGDEPDTGTSGCGCGGAGDAGLVAMLVFALLRRRSA